jgi:hypothetical protein
VTPPSKLGRSAGGQKIVSNFPKILQLERIAFDGGTFRFSPQKQATNMPFNTFFDNAWWIMAQTSSTSTWVDALMEIETRKLILIFVFGTGLIIGCGYAIASIVRASNGTPEDVDELKSQIDELERRVRKLEQRT